MSTIYKSAAGERALVEAYADILARWPQPRQQLRLQTRHGDTAVIASGPEDAPPLILLHGAGSNSLTWMGDAEVWARTFRVYAVDIIGEPGASAPVRLPYATGDYADWLDDVLAGLGVERACFVGLSLGGWLSLDYALRRPERVERLILMCPGGIGRTKPGFMLKAGPLLALGGWGRRRLLKLIAGDYASGEVGAYLDLIFTHFKPRRDALPFVSDESLAALRTPTLTILGARDELIDSADTARRLAKAPAVEVVMLPEAGHVIAEQAERVLRFLGR